MFRSIAIISCCSLLTVANAATVVIGTGGVGGDAALRILDLPIGQQTYNVEFQRNTFDNLNVNNAFPFLGDQSGAEVAADAINAELDSVGVGLVGFGTRPQEKSNSYYIPYEIVVSTIPVNDLRFIPSAYLSPGWTRSTPAAVTRSGETWYATMTVVPIPAAAWLFGSALGLLGVARKRLSN